MFLNRPSRALRASERNCPAGFPDDICAHEYTILAFAIRCYACLQGVWSPQLCFPSSFGSSCRWFAPLRAALRLHWPAGSSPLAACRANSLSFSESSLVF